MVDDKASTMGGLGYLKQFEGGLRNIREAGLHLTKGGGGGYFNGGKTKYGTKIR